MEENNIYIVTKVHFEGNKLYKQEDFKLSKRIIFLNTEIMNEHLCTIYHIMDAFDGLITDYSSIYVNYLREINQLFFHVLILKNTRKIGDL